MIRNAFISACAVAVLSVCTLPASAGLFCKKDCCDPCCEPEPVCCAPAPAPVCPPPAPVCCAPAPVCPPPAPADVQKTVCLCNAKGCPEAVSLCIPACCANEEPCITCRKGIFGRKVYTLTWKCCNHCATVVMTKHGRVIVR